MLHVMSHMYLVVFFLGSWLGTIPPFGERQEGRKVGSS